MGVAQSNCQTSLPQCKDKCLLA